MRKHFTRTHFVASAIGFAAAGVSFAASAPTPTAKLAPPPHVDTAVAPPRGANDFPGLDSLFGRSGKLRFRLLDFSRGPTLSFLSRFFGDSILPSLPGVYPVEAGGRPFSFITMLPFSVKVGARIGSYRLGLWPSERRRVRVSGYENPDGFITVTPENQDTYVSEHFRLRDFLTHDQPNVWPKYLVLREDLLDKLELVADELIRSGVNVQHVRVMSGFRTPLYNESGGETAGRAALSRHMYGDAADIFIDNDGDGRMDDLNHDGRVDSRDAQVIIDAAERVERRHPELVGGAGRYRGTRAHGPFAHIDVRGYRARWGRT